MKARQSQSSAKALKVFIKTLTGQGFEVELPGASPTVSALREAVANKVGGKAEDLKLVHKGKVMKSDDGLLADVGFSSGGQCVVFAPVSSFCHSDCRVRRQSADGHECCTQ